MQQVLAVLSGDADTDGLNSAIGEGQQTFLAPNVLVADGDETVRDALKALACVSAVLSDDDAKAAAAANDISAMEVSAMSDLVSSTLSLNQSPDESTVLAIAGWMFGLSDQYATWKSDRPRDGETWDMDGGCLPTDEATANA